MKNNKFESNKKYFTISIYSIVVILIGCIIFRLVNNWASTVGILTDLWNTIFPFFIGFLIAYVMNPVVTFFNEKVFSSLFGEKRKRLCRACAILTTYIILVGALTICLIFIVPQLYDSIKELSSQIPVISDQIMGLLDHYKESGSGVFPAELMETLETKSLPKLVQLSNQMLTEAIPMLYNFSVSFVKWLFNLFIAFVVSIYMTADKQLLKSACRRLIFAVFPYDAAVPVIHGLKECHNIFSGYIIGKSLDSLIIGFLCFLLMSLLNLPYTVLISVIVGVTNMIPYFGPFIGAVPGAFILFIVSPYKTLIFLGMILVLQQFDGLVLGPKILGNSTGVRPILILFSITVGGAYFGPLGMFLGVPFFAVVQYLVNNWSITDYTKRTGYRVGGIYMEIHCCHCSVQSFTGTGKKSL